MTEAEKLEMYRTATYEPPLPVRIRFEPRPILRLARLRIYFAGIKDAICRATERTRAVPVQLRPGEEGYEEAAWEMGYDQSPLRFELPQQTPYDGTNVG